MYSCGGYFVISRSAYSQLCECVADAPCKVKRHINESLSGLVDDFSAVNYLADLGSNNKRPRRTHQCGPSESTLAAAQVQHGAGLGLAGGGQDHLQVGTSTGSYGP